MPDVSSIHPEQKNNINRAPKRATFMCLVRKEIKNREQLTENAT